MMDTPLFEKLHAEGLISEASLNNIKADTAPPLFSLHWELKTLLYLGVLLLSGGLGIAVYKNIDTIGHQAILAFIALVCCGCFYYCIKNKKPFTTHKVESPNAFYDYILLFGCLTFISFVAYLQFEYNVFGNRYGLATFIPMVVLFFVAYTFDHLGILSMAITNLAAWAGITVTPRHLLESDDFSETHIIISGFALSVLLMLAAFASTKRDVKKHFAFTYDNFGVHLLFISCLAALFQFDYYFAWFFLLAAAGAFCYRKARLENSFYFLLVTVLYCYIGLSYTFIRLLGEMNTDMGGIYVGLLYFIGSGFGLIIFLMRANKKMKTV